MRGVLLNKKCECSKTQGNFPLTVSFGMVKCLREHDVDVVDDFSEAIMATNMGKECKD
jgi:hypothetical protein